MELPESLFVDSRARDVSTGGPWTVGGRRGGNHTALRAGGGGSETANAGYMSSEGPRAEYILESAGEGLAATLVPTSGAAAEYLPHVAIYRDDLKAQYQVPPHLLARPHLFIFFLFPLSLTLYLFSLSLPYTHTHTHTHHPTPHQAVCRAAQA